MNALLLWPEFPSTYWSYSYSLKLVGKKSLTPPLPLLTVAAMLPKSWKASLVDLNVRPVGDAELRKADVVLISGMFVQRASIHDLVDRCRRLGTTTIVGGPFATSQPHLLGEADHVFTGEGEGCIESMCADLEAGTLPHRVRGDDKPDLTTSPTPRYDLLEADAYFHMALQYSRGCPFSCEFCDIIVMYGRVPRVKTPEQIAEELDAIAATGFRGSVFFVDDNFIGNKKAVRKLLPAVRDWQERHDHPFHFYTEASLNLAEDSTLMTSMVETGFNSVFIGIESPSAEAISEMRKSQNLRGEISERVHQVLQHGMDVWAGFILGFDSDGPKIFDDQIEVIERAAIPFAMVGLLYALPGTPLTARLEAEGRLRDFDGEDQFARANFEPKMPEVQLLGGYKKVLGAIYDPKRYLDRVLAMMRLRRVHTHEKRKRIGFRQIVWGARALITQGLLSRYAAEYRRFLREVWRWDPSRLVEAIQRAGAGHHFIEYTRRVVLPRLDEAINDVQAAAHKR